VTFAQLLPIVLQALMLRSVAFAFTIGTSHFAATISDTGTPGNSGSFLAILGVIGQIMAGQPGTFHSGVFTLVIQELAPAPVSAPTFAVTP
jgi:hypothetical protein